MNEEERVGAPALAAVPNPVPPPQLAEIFREHHAAVYRTAYRITGNPMDAEDVAQTVFLRLLRREEGHGLSDTPGAYLRQAAVRGALDVIRARRSARANPLEESEPTLADDGTPSPEAKAVGRDLREQLRRALTELPPRSAEVFSLRYLEGYDNREIARMTGLSRTGVAVSLHRSRHRLKGILATLAGGAR